MFPYRKLPGIILNKSGKNWLIYYSKWSLGPLYPFIYIYSRAIFFITFFLFFFAPISFCEVVSIPFFPHWFLPLTFFATFSHESCSILKVHFKHKWFHPVLLRMWKCWLERFSWCVANICDIFIIQKAHLIFVLLYWASISFMLNIVIRYSVMLSYSFKNTKKLYFNNRLMLLLFQTIAQSW